MPNVHRRRQYLPALQVAPNEHFPRAPHMELIDSTGTRQACDRCHRVRVRFAGKADVCVRCKEVAKLARLRVELRHTLVREAVRRAVREANAEVDRIHAGSGGNSAA